ncbi:TolC family outer membrane protein [Shimia sp. W99]|uniref:Outer membrane protein n=1 Tax=Shimia aestuarii TaxID=254406 RepID=A0A1I4IMF5_9RHOB|nr:TolC family outer membrane protein [Shimia aestuarii]SFL55474.1 outer membrane protein [Shimia aestuarii]
MFQQVRKAVRTGALAFSVSVLAVASASAETLSDAMVSAYRHSGLLEQNRALLRAADEDVAATLALLRPVLNWFGEIRHTSSNARNAGSVGRVVSNDRQYASIGLEFQLLLFDNGATRLAVDAAKETVLATRQALVSVEQAVLFDAVQAFMSVVRDTEIVLLRQNNLRVLERELQAARDRFEVGEVTRTDVALAEARLEGARAQLAAAQGDLLQSQEFYASAIGHRPGKLTAPTRLPYTAKSVDDAKAVAIRSHPEMIRAQHEISAAELNVLRTKAQMGPTVSLGARYGTEQEFGNNFFSDGASVGVTLGGPIYQGGRLSALSRQAMARRDAVRAGLHVTRHGIREAAGSSWARLIASGAAITSSERQVDAARIAFEGVREEAKLGARTTLDVLTAEQDLLDAEANLITAMATQHIAAYAVLSSMGLLTIDHLNLRVEQYDPEAYYNLVKDAPAVHSKRGKQLDKVLKSLGKAADHN